MARKARRRSGRGSDDSDGGGSNATVSTASGVGDTVGPDGDGVSDVEATDGNFFAEADALTDKRRWVRDEAVARLTARLCAGVPSAALEAASVGEALADGLFRGGLKRGDGAEAAAAARLLGLLVLTLADGDAGGPTAAASIASRSAEALLFRGRSAAVADPGAAAEAAALALFVASDDATESEEALGALERMLTPAGVRASKAAAAPAARAWTLLASALGPAAVVARVARGSYVRVAPGGPPPSGPPPVSVAASLRKLATQVVDADAQLAAAQALALILELREAGGGDGDDTSDGDAPWGGDSTDEDEAEGGAGDGFGRRPRRSEAAARAARRQAEADSIGVVTAALADVALGSSTSRARVPKSQRAGRRALAATAGGGGGGGGGGDEVDAVTLCDGETVVAETVGDRRRLDAFRRLLGTGLRPHLEANSVLRGIFDLPPAVAGFVDDGEGGGGGGGPRRPRCGQERPLCGARGGGQGAAEGYQPAAGDAGPTVECIWG